MSIKGWHFRPVYQVMVGSKVVWTTENKQSAFKVSDKYPTSIVVLVEPDHNMDNTDGQIHHRPSVEGMSDRELMEEIVRNQRIGKNAIRELTNAIRLTVEYVGNDTLPPKEGWSWYDALRKYAPDMADQFTNPPKVVRNDNLPTFPYQSGDVTVLGPETFKSGDDQVICHKGVNYRRDSEPKFPTPTGVMGTAVVIEGSSYLKIRGFFGPYSRLGREVGFWRIDEGSPTWWHMDRIDSFKQDPVLTLKALAKLNDEFSHGVSRVTPSTITHPWARKLGLDV